MTTKGQAETDAAAKRTRRRRKNARPPEIIEAGLLEFAEKGFAGARLDDVARRAGVAKGTLYLYFDSKEALFRAAVRSRISPVVDQVTVLAAGWTGSCAALLETLLRGVYGRIAEGDLRILLRIIIAESPRFPEIAAFYHKEFIAKGKALIGMIIRRGIDTGEFRDGPHARQPLVVMGPAILAAIWKMTFEESESLDLDAMAAAHLDLILNGLRNG